MQLFGEGLIPGTTPHVPRVEEAVCVGVAAATRAK